MTSKCTHTHTHSHTGCGLHGYSLVSFLLQHLNPNAVIILLSHGNVILLFLILSVYIHPVARKYVSSDDSGWQGSLNYANIL